MLRKTLTMRAKSAMQIVECPRDAMQGLPNFVATDDKIRYINKLLKVGFHTIDFGSFVSAPAVPQMRDTVDVLKGLDLKNTKSELLAIVCNKKGAEAAAEHPEIKYLGFPLSMSEEFQRRNTRRSIADAMDVLKDIKGICDRSNKELVTYISMAFGNPYGEEYSPEFVAKFVSDVRDLGVRTISLADTVGTGTAEEVTSLFEEIVPKYPDTVIGAHLHSSSSTSPAKISAAIAAGCTRIDGAIGGMGGCPFAKSALIGNVPTESIIQQCNQHGLDLGLDMKQFEEAHQIKHELFGVAVSEIILQCYLGDNVAFRQLCESHYRDADVNGDGKLSREEFTGSVKRVVEELGETVSEEKLDELWKVADSTEGMSLETYCSLAREKILKRLASA
eukprot:TRINITY_DN3235_c1_g1_i2.p1 TRINITY_DN3235_c1_g1~~TRINITY_DN3235_c1_g1_i2.p1  ORF type:complete len:402 (+),score=91.46 TRINITY_DN3235_c1_g1_i2:39-1208(+)